MAAETLVPVDAEVAVVTELSTRLSGLLAPGFHVGTRIPGEPMPAEFLRVVDLGGYPRDLVSDLFTIALEGFATTESRAFRITAVAAAALGAAGRDGAVGGVTSYGADIVGLPGNLPLPSLPTRFRFTSQVAVSLRRVVL